MDNNFIPYSEALVLKELGFDEPCFAYYEVSDNLTCGYRLRYIEHEDTNPAKQPLNDDCLAPLYQQVFRWFRENYKLLGIVSYCDDKSGKFMSMIDKINGDYDYDMKIKNNYEEAELICLQKLIEIVQNEKY